MSEPLTPEEVVEKALLYVFQLSNKDYRKMQTALSETVFIRALEQDGYTVAREPAAQNATPAASEGLPYAYPPLHDDCFASIPHLHERPYTRGQWSDTAWLIERGQSMNHAPTVWWTGERIPNVEQWTTDANKAKRFSSRMECETQIDALSGFAIPSHGDRFGVATEHVFLAASPSSDTPNPERFDRTWSHYADDCPVSPAASEGLREALHDLQDWLIRPDRSYSPHEIAMYAHDRIAAALATSPSSDTRPEPCPFGFTSEDECIVVGCPAHDALTPPKPAEGSEP